MIIISGIVKTVTIVTVFSCFERFLGFIYRIFLSRTLGSEGLGAYQIALTLFGVLLTFLASGVPITVSRLMTKYRSLHDKQAERDVITAGVLFTLIFSIPLVAILFLLRNRLDFLFSDESAKQIFYIVLPGLIFTSVYAVFRGSFWGNKCFLTYSIIELLEELSMLLIGIILITFSVGKLSDEDRAGIAVIASYLFSFTLSSLIFFIRKGKFGKPRAQLAPLFSSAMPITLMRTGSSLINSAVAVILPARLIASGLSAQQALSQFGVALGMAIPLLFLPSTLIGSLAVVLVPELSENFYKQQNRRMKRNIEKALVFSVFTASVVIPLYISLGKELCILFYANENAGIYLSFAAIIMLPMSISMISTSMLNSLNCEKQTLLYFLIGSAFMLLSIYFLPKYLGIYSLLIGFAMSFSTSSVLNVSLLKKKSREKIVFTRFTLLSLLFIAPSALLGFFIKNLLKNILPLFFRLAVSGLCVVAFVLIFYAIFGLIDFKRLFYVYVKRRKE